MTRSRIQKLILEVLNAQPSLRDSKGYLNAFGPRNPKQQLEAKRSQGGGDGIKFKKLTPQPIQQQQQQQQSHNNIDHHGESHSHPDSQIASTSKTMLQHHIDHSTPQDGQSQHDHHTSNGTSTIPASSNASNNNQPEDPGASFEAQQHTALVKVQGPFTRRQLESIADGMIYLKKLGLVSVIVVDGEDWSLPGYASTFSTDGRRLEEEEEEREDLELAPWISPSSAQDKRQQRREMSRMRRISLRRTMLNQVSVLAEMLQSRGAPARPFLAPQFRVDAEAAKEAERLAPRHFPGSTAQATNSSSITSSSFLTQEKETIPTQPYPQVRAFGYRQMQASPCRSPLVSDDGLSSLRSALATDHIPVIAPLALYSDPEQGGAETSTPVKADDVLVALARDMAIAGQEAEEELLLREEEGADSNQGSSSRSSVATTAQVDMMPLRLMVINREGGIPSHARGGNPHLSINLASEYSIILNSFVWKDSHPTAMDNLRMVHDCLSYMPHTSSGIVVSHRSPRSLIANLITNKAAHSPSLPPALLKSSRRDLRHTPTIIRPGLAVNVIYDFSQVDQDKLTALLESSFKRTLDSQAYYARLKDKCDFVIITGDYQGAAIVTRESLPGEEEAGIEPVAYLDKFAVLPSLQGSGTVDFLWGALRDEVQGLGLLDALNNNGGKCGFGKGRDLVWKSRSENPVNKWYFERSNGFVKIDTDSSLSSSSSEKEEKEEKEKEEKEKEKKKLNWAMFWCDAEDRLSSMSGERRLRTSATEEEMRSVLLQDLDSESESQSEAAGVALAGENRQGRLNFTSNFSNGIAHGVAPGASGLRGVSGRFMDLEEGEEGWGQKHHQHHHQHQHQQQQQSLSSVTSSGMSTPIDTTTTGRIWSSSMMNSSEGGAPSSSTTHSTSIPNRVLYSSTSSSSSSLSTYPHPSSHHLEQQEERRRERGRWTGSGTTGTGMEQQRILLPLIAPEERGRLQRWARCMMRIPSAWK